MFRCILIVSLVWFSDAIAKDRGGDFDACDKGQSEIAEKVASYKGEAQIKRVIEADLARAKREEAEGDADECLEAIDHAHKLIAGEY